MACKPPLSHSYYGPHLLTVGKGGKDGMGYFKEVRTYIFDDQEPTKYTIPMKEHDLPVLAADKIELNGIQVHVEKNPGGDYIYYNFDLIASVNNKPVSAVRITESSLTELHAALGKEIQKMHGERL